MMMTFGVGVFGRLLLTAAILVMAAVPLRAQTIGSFNVGSAAVTPGGYVSLYAKNVTAGGSAIAGVRFYREANGTGGLQPGSDAYVGLGVYANGMWTFAAPTTGLSGTQTYYAVAYDTAGNASPVASVNASVSGSGFSNWNILGPFLAKAPLPVGPIPSTSVVNFGTTIYTGPLDTTITLDRIRGDNGPNRSGDGAQFTNNGNPPLPTNRGSFYEFTIDPQTGCSPSFTSGQIAFPGPMRFMIDTSGDIYFTGDHYSTDLNLYVAGTPSVGSVAASPSSTTAGTAVTLTASNVSETISPAPNLNANTGVNVLAAVSNVQFFLETNGTAGLQTDTDQLLGSGIQNGSTWTLTNVPTAGLAANTYTVYAVGVDPAGNIATQTTTLTITSAGSQPPSVTTSAASGVTTNAATLNGSLNPNGQTTTAQFEYGLTTSYGTVVPLTGTFTGSNSLAVSTNLTGFAPATTYHFRLDATNASGLMLGNDQSFTTVAVSSGTAYGGILAAWEVTGLGSYGPSPFAAASNAPNVTVFGLTRGSGVGTANTAATNTWGGTGFVYANEAAAIAGNSFAAFSVSNSTTGTISFTNIAAYNIRHSSTGSTNGIWQYQVGNGVFTDIGSAIIWGANTSSSGNAEPAIDLSGISALQNVGAGSNVTFRIVLWGGTGTGTWYINNISSGYDLALSGSISYPAPAVVLTPIQLWRQQWFGTTNNSAGAADTFVASSDGMPNLLKYALGLNPLIPATNPITGDLAGGFLRLTVPRNPNATDITYLIESTADLGAAWSTNAIFMDTNTPALLSGHDTNAVPANSRRFIRLHVTNP